MANIYFVYISEAHAADVWPIGLSAGVINYSHKTLKDRIKCAKNFKKRYNFKIPIWVDDIDNNLRDTLSLWPFRLLIIKDMKFRYISQIKNAEYDIIDVYNFFNSL